MLSYGLSAYGFAARNHTSEEEAQRLIEKFFSAFPSIKSFLHKCGQFGVATNTINNATLGRIRFFDKWKTAKHQDFYGNWTYKNPEEMRGVMRQAMNFPIQSGGADLLKVSGVLMKRWIDNNNLRDFIQLVIPYHDQWVLYAREDYAQLAKEKLEHFMKLAGKLLLKNDLLRAEANISDFWIKD